MTHFVIQISQIFDDFKELAITEKLKFLFG